MDEWVLWFYIKPFILHLKRDGANSYCPPTVLVPVLVPFPAADTVSVITPLVNENDREAKVVGANKNAFQHCVTPA